MSDWSDDALAKLEKKREATKLRNETLLEKERIKRIQGEPLWLEIRTLVKEECKSFNTKAGEEMLSFRETNSKLLEVVANIDGEVRELQAAFDASTGKLSWACGAKKGEWYVATTDDGNARFQWGQVPTTPASMVKQMLDALVFG